MTSKINPIYCATQRLFFFFFCMCVCVYVYLHKTYVHFSRSVVSDSLTLGGAGCLPSHLVGRLPAPATPPARPTVGAALGHKDELPLLGR